MKFKKGDKVILMCEYSRHEHLKGCEFVILAPGGGRFVPEPWYKLEEGNGIKSAFEKHLILSTKLTRALA